MPPIFVERLVRFEHGDLDGVRMMVRSEFSDLSAGTRIEVEVGARWTEANGRRERVGGQWIPCVVITDHPRELVVRLAG